MIKWNSVYVSLFVCVCVCDGRSHQRLFICQFSCIACTSQMKYSHAINNTNENMIINDMSGVVYTSHSRLHIWCQQHICLHFLLFFSVSVPISHSTTVSIREIVRRESIFSLFVLSFCRNHVQINKH